MYFLKIGLLFKVVLSFKVFLRISPKNIKKIIFRRFIKLVF